VLIAVGGYFLSLGLFFRFLPLTQIATSVKGAEPTTFVYSGRQYVDGAELEAREPLTIKYPAPRILGFGRARHLELLVQVPRAPERVPAGGKLGELRVSTNGETTIEEVANQPLQRIFVDWPTKAGKNATRLSYRPVGRARDFPIVVGINAHAGFLRPAGVLLAVGAAALILAAMRRRWLTVRHAALGSPFLVMTYLHSAAFISNDYFSGGGPITSGARAASELLAEGHLPEVFYRSAGFGIVPLITGAVTGDLGHLHEGAITIFPAIRYVTFLLTVAALAYLLLGLRRHFGTRFAVATGFVYATFVPFILDLYAPDSDAFLIPLVTALVGAFVRVTAAADDRSRRRLYALMGALLFFMGTLKITVAFLGAAVAFAIFVGDLARDQRITRVAVKRVGVVGLGLTLAFGAGVVVSSRFDHPHRNIGIEGEPFQGSVLWHMVWAANGTFDSYNQFGFTKAAGLRNLRVEAATGLPHEVTYIRQSQRATDELYKPGVRSALRVSAGYFVGNAYIRAYREGVNLYRYTRGAPEAQEWAMAKRDTIVTDAGEMLEQDVDKDIYLSRRNRGWKVAPLVLATRLTQQDLGRIGDVILLAIGIIGILYLRRTELVVFLLLLVAAKLSTQIGIHAPNRYLMYSNVAPILGLGAVVTVGARRIAASIRSTDWAWHRTSKPSTSAS
jgi:hypothetical protein